MKVHKCQIEVMWLFLTTMFCRVTNEKEIEYSKSIKLKEFVYKDNYEILNVRPPP